MLVDVDVEVSRFRVQVQDLVQSEDLIEDVPFSRVLALLWRCTW